MLTKGALVTPTHGRSQGQIMRARNYVGFNVLFETCRFWKKKSRDIKFPQGR